MPLHSRCLLLALCLLASGCGGSQPKTYDAQEVRDVLRAHGFKVEVTCGSDERPFETESCFGEQGGTVVDLLKLFSDANLEGVRAVVLGDSSRELPVTAWVLDSESRADSWEDGWSRPNKVVARLQWRNVVVLVSKGQEERARAAVEDLD